MNKTFLAACIVAAGTGTAVAGGSPGSIGVGAEFVLAPAILSGGQTIGGPSINYDAGAFHVGGMLAIVDPAGDDNTAFGVGGRFFYHVHSTALADFGIGGSLTYINQDTPGGSDGLFYIEPGIQVRAFVATNVALSLSAGLTIGAADADGVALTGNPTGAAGFHYYFF